MSKGSDSTRKALGRGLSSLLPTRPTAAPPPEPAPRPADSVAQVSVDLIDPNPVQPRENFQADRLHELAQSILANGIIQPLVLRRRNERYQLIAGERRWRAAKMAGLDTVPAVIREIHDDRLLEVSLIENIQREDLNPIESAHAFDRLSREFKLTHEEIARRTGKDRATITNILRLLRLPEDVQQLLAERKIAMGHARALLGLPTEDKSLEYGSKVLFLPSTEAGVSEVAKNSKAIFYAGLGYVTDKVKPVAIKKTADDPAVLPSVETALDGTYPIARPLLFYTNGAPQSVIKAFIDYCLSPEGQEKVTEVGYVPLA